jgi:hypothetical protein
MTGTAPIAAALRIRYHADVKDAVQAQVVVIPTNKIVDWKTFHDVFDEALGFPGYYGRNMDAWIDCFTYADDPESGMVANSVANGDLLILSIVEAAEFKQRCREQFDALIDCAAFVNFRRREAGASPVLALLIDGNFAQTRASAVHP